MPTATAHLPQAPCPMGHAPASDRNSTRSPATRLSRTTTGSLTTTCPPGHAPAPALTPRRPRHALALLLALGTACGSTGAEPFTYPAEAAGPGPGPHPLGDWQVTLTRADVAVGPIYFCATAAASPDLCDVAVAELLDPSVADALATAPEPLAEITSLPGEIRSAMLDYGVSWFPTASDFAATTDLGHSARLVGEAVRGDMSVSFDAIVDVAPPTRGSPAVVGARATALDEDPTRLELELPVHAWLAGVDWDALAAAGPTAEIRPGDPAHAAIVFAMTTQPPAFLWTAD
jgi:hypothetical protein